MSLRQLPLLILLLLSVCLPACASEQTGKVLWIYDGDTLKVEGIGKVRLLGIDTPEQKGSSRDRFYRERFQIHPRQLRRISRQAKKFNIEQAKGQRVRLETEQQERDQHDRLLAYVYLPDGQLLNQLLLEKGLASVFRRYDFGRKQEFLAVEERARSQQLGLWQQHP